MDLDALEYQFSIDGQVKQSWNTFAVYDWVTTAIDKGNHTIKCEVRDNRGGLVSKESSLAGFRQAVGPPVR